jgi:SAM-dependent methyltransferase
MSAALPPAEISDYDGFDFRALWGGRDKVTEVERRLLFQTFFSGDRRRLLEVGTGFGRLLGSVEDVAEEVVAIDFDLGSLTRLDSNRPGASRTLRVAANLYHLPFVDGSFTGATMVRVYHHLSDPAGAFRELRRVLRPRSRLFVSYNPRPTIGTLVNDIQRALHPAPHVPFRSVTFSRKTRVELTPDPFPVYVGPREEFQAAARRSGFATQLEFGSGLEEYYFSRHVPADWFVRIGTALGRAPGFPMRFAVLEVPDGHAHPLPPREEIVACPVCHEPLEPGERGAHCRECAFTGTSSDGVLDLRYVPDGTVRWRRGHGVG